MKRALAADDDERPVYVRIAVALSNEIAAGGLKASERLPSQRRLADALGVNLTTVTKSFKYLKDRGVVSAHVGRGTAVRGRGLDHIAPTYERLQALPRVDLSVLKQHSAAFDAAAAAALREIAAETASVADLCEYHPAAGPPAAREMAVRWLRDTRIEAAAEDVAITAGAQHGLLLVLAAVMKPGDLVLVPALTYQGVKTAAQMLGLGLIPVAVDEGGILPDALARHAGNPRVKAIYLTPTLDNPTSITLSLERRRAIADVAARHALVVVEDEVFRPLAREFLPSIRELYPQGTFHLSSVAKVMAPGLRCGFVVSPAAYAGAVLRALRGSMWMAAPLTVTLVARLIAAGSHTAVIDELRERLLRRHDSAAAHLGRALRPGGPEGNCLWIDLPGALPASEFTDFLRGEGIGVAPSTMFSTGPSMHNGIRLYKGSVASDADWNEAVRTIAQCIERPPRAGERV
ncbi:PLP-dependent aminotransferase family protein [Verticiella sediminum]|uniref:aminotransferase-like domain-containing protein n=1 Tax=Verticiella sediminum TaxID=1247510 RepID=UPI001FE7507E|nr:PLP-dependent aminotransferase family protein [Verticiella sediminum]